jgi:hypothetical protein
MKVTDKIQIKVAETIEEKKLADNIVVKYHSYVNSSKTVGRCLKYLIYYEDRIVGTFWIGSGFKPTPKNILSYFNKSQKEFDVIFNEIADNKRFCMIEKIPNLGSQILKLIRNRAKHDWYIKYKNNLRAIITTIGDGKNGAVYLSDNWIKIGETAGLPKREKSVSMKWNNQEEIKERYIKPTGENKKIILITDKLKINISNNNPLELQQKLF